MSFLRPEFLWALPLVAVPVIIHLMNRRRFQVVEFSAVEFLRAAIRKTRRRLLLEDLLLLLLRTLAVLLLILALAHPGADPDAILGGRPARGEVLVLDASLSMGQREGGNSAFERAMAKGLAILSDLDRERGDLGAVIVAGSQAERVAYGDPEEVRAALEEMDEPGQGRAALAQALSMARQTAAGLMNEGPERVRITVLSDLQSTGWDLVGAEGEALRALAADGHLLSIVDAGGKRRANTAVTWIEVEPAELSPGDFGEVHARVRNFGREARPALRATLLLDGVPLDQTQLAIEADEEQTWTHPIAPAQAGPRAVEVRLEGDSLVGDDNRAFIARVRPAPRVLLVGEPAPAGQPEGVFDSMRRFLDLGESAPVQYDSRSPGRTGAPVLEKTDVVVLADPGRLPPAAVQALVEFQARGGGLLLALGPETKQAPALLESLDAGGISFREIVPRQDPAARLRITDPTHPALAFFSDPRWQPLLTEVPFERFRLVRLDPGQADPDLFAVPLRFATPAGEEGDLDQGAALVEWTRHGGRVVLLAAAPMPLWNRMDAIPGGTLPFLIDLISHMAPRPAHPLAVEVGDPLWVELPRPPTEVTLIDPAGRSTYPPATATLLAGNRVRQPLLDRAEQAGVWTVAARMLDSDGMEVMHRERIAVLTPPSESDLAPLDPEQLESLLPPGTDLSGEILEGEEVEVDSEARPRDLAHLFYLAVAGALVLETLLAGILDRRRG